MLRSGLWSVHLANKKSALYGALHHGALHNPLHNPFPVLFHVKLPFLWQAVEENQWCNTFGRLLNRVFALPGRREWSQAPPTGIRFIPCKNDLWCIQQGSLKFRRNLSAFPAFATVFNPLKSPSSGKNLIVCYRQHLK